MAIFTYVAGPNVVLIFADSVCAVVAANAIVRNRCMIEFCRNPAVGRVAAIAIVAAGYVRWVFSDRDCIVVAGLACTDDLSMINHHYWLPDR